jgi:hypothetical protein
MNTSSHRNHSSSWKGNKSSLPSKPCAVCGRTMTWRRAWARNWEQVLYCSDACRKQRPRGGTDAARDHSSGDTPRHDGRNDER